MENTNPSQGSGSSSSKRKHDSYASSSVLSSGVNSPSESHVPPSTSTSTSTNSSDWNQSYEGKEIIRQWIQIENTWTEKGRIWGQHEFDWYKRMNNQYQRWSTDENSDKSVHPSELIWASMKLDQAKREAMHCREWVAYARWQVASRTKKGVGACPLLPSLDGRIPVGNNDRPLSLLRERDDRNDDGGHNDDDKPTQDEGRSTKLGPAQNPTQAFTQAPMKDSTQDKAQDPHKASETFVALVKSTSQSSTAVQTHFQTFTKAPQAPVQAFTQNTSQNISGNVSEEFATFLQLQETSQNHIAFQTPVHASFRAPSKQVVSQAPVQDITFLQDSINASLQSRNLPPVQNSARVFKAPSKMQDLVQTPFQSPQAHQPPEHPKMSWSPQLPVPSQQQNLGQASGLMPLLTFAEFVATGSQQPEGQSIGKPTFEQASQKNSKMSTQEPTQRPNQSRIQKAAHPRTSLRGNSPKVAQRVVTQQATHKTTRNPTQQPTQFIHQPKQAPPQSTRHDPLPESSSCHNNTTAHGKALHHSTSNFGETRGNTSPSANYVDPPLFCAPTAATIPPATPATPAGPATPADPIIFTDPINLIDPVDFIDPVNFTGPVTFTDPEVSELVSGWWERWTGNSPEQFASLGGAFGQDNGMLSGQVAMPESGLYSNEDFETPVWDDF